MRKPFLDGEVPTAEMLQPCRVGEQRGDASAKGTEEQILPSEAGKQGIGCRTAVAQPSPVPQPQSWSSAEHHPLMPQKRSRKNVFLISCFLPELIFGHM